MDQASTLRQIVSHKRANDPEFASERGRMRVIAITSGKGGVGKTNIVLNLCMALAQRGRRVLLLDADMGLANVDVLLGLTPRYTLEHVLKGQKGVNDIILTGPHGIRLLPSSSGMSELSELSFEQQMHLFQALSQIDEQLDYLFIDTGAGVSSNVLRFNASANEIMVVASPEPTSITDAYALMKLLSIKYHIRDFNLVANSVQNEQEGLGVFNRLNAACGQFLQVSLNYLGCVPFDQSIRKAVRQQRAVFDLYPQSPAGKSIARLAVSLEESRPSPSQAPSGASGSAAQSDPAGTSAGLPLRSFWDRLLHWKKA